MPKTAWCQMEWVMKKRIITKNQSMNSNRQKIIQLCFDSKSIDNFSPGFKMIFALNDPPLFVTLEEVDDKTTGGQIH